MCTAPSAAWPPARTFVPPMSAGPVYRPDGKHFVDAARACSMPSTAVDIDATSNDRQHACVDADRRPLAVLASGVGLELVCNPLMERFGTSSKMDGSSVRNTNPLPASGVPHNRSSVVHAFSAVPASWQHVFTPSVPCFYSPSSYPRSLLLLAQNTSDSARSLAVRRGWCLGLQCFG